MKRYLLVLVFGLIVACNVMRPAPTPTPVPTATATNTQSPTPTSSPTVTPIPGTPTPLPPEYTLIQVYHYNGPILEQLAGEVAKAEVLGQIPILEFSAGWCPGCITIATSLEEKDKYMVKAFKGVYLIQANVDSWHWEEMNKLGFKFEVIPVFFKLNAEGKPTGERFDGRDFTSDSIFSMARDLDKFFHSRP
jgi:hypothetical protein